MDFICNRAGKTLSTCLLLILGIMLPYMLSLQASGILTVTHRALWVWNTADLLNDQNNKEEFLRFVNNLPGTDKKIRTVFLYIQSEWLGSQETRVRDLISELHKAGVRVDCLNGNHDWAVHHSGALSLAEHFIQYQKRVNKEERFDGFQYDVEPYLITAYNNPKYKEKIQKGYVDLLAETRQAFKKQGLSVWFGAAVPTFYEEDFLEEILVPIDYLAIMDYYDRANMIIYHASKIMKVCEKKKKKAYVGLETQAPSQRWGVTPTVTFYEEGYEKMERVISLVSDEMSRYQSFAGIALHHYTSYWGLSAEGRKVTDKTIYPEMPEIEVDPMKDVKIDGDLREWDIRSSGRTIKLDQAQDVVYGKDQWEGPEDYSALLRFGWSGKYFYLAASIKDDRIVQKNKAMDMVNGDHLELWFDFDMASDKDISVPDDDDFQFGFSPGNFSNVPQSLTYWYPDMISRTVMSNILFCFKRTIIGYDAEIAIPWSAYPAFKPEPGAVLRMNVDPSDTDLDETKQESLLSTSSFRELANPRTFRTLRLR